jgi:hypothetical protein
MIAALRETVTVRSSTSSAGTGPSRADIALYQGDDYSALVFVLQGDGSAADLTGYTPQAQIRRNVADSTPEIAAEFTAVLADAVTGQISLSLTHAVTLMLTGRYIWDLQITGGDGIVTTVLAGSVSVRQEVTR